MAGTKGKKSVRWDRDPQILARLESVAQMMLRSARAWQIADALDVSLRTAKRDIRRVRTLWRRESERKIEESRQQSIAQIRAIQQQAWTEYDKVKRVGSPVGLPKADKKGGKAAPPKTVGPKSARDGTAWLKLVRECEKDIVELEGTRAPLKVAPTDPTGEKEYGESGLTDEQRFTRLMAVLDKARARRDATTPGSAGPDEGGADASGVDA
jgi:hypothetical protein